MLKELFATLGIRVPVDQCFSVDEVDEILEIAGKLGPDAPNEAYAQEIQKIVNRAHHHDEE